MWSIILSTLCLAALGSAKDDLEKINNYIYRNGTRFYVAEKTINRTDALGLLYYENTTNSNIRGAVDVINAKNEPTWIKKNSYQDPDLNVIQVNGQNTVRYYFAAKNKQTKKLDISVAYYPTFFTFDQYNTVDYQLIYNDTYDNYSPTMASFDGKLLLTFVHNQRQDITAVGVQYLDDTGMGVDGPPQTRGSRTAVEPDQPWEGKQLKNQWAFNREEYLYIFYETEFGFLGVARSTNPLGKFEKIPEPLFSKEKAHLTREHLQKNLGWAKNGWPYIRA